MRALALRALGGLLLIADLVLLLIALYHGLHIESTEAAARRAEKGQAMGIPAGLSAAAAVLTLIGARRRWAPAALAVALGLAALSVYVLITREAPQILPIE